MSISEIYTSGEITQVAVGRKKIAFIAPEFSTLALINPRSHEIQDRYLAEKPAEAMTIPVFSLLWNLKDKTSESIFGEIFLKSSLALSSKSGLNSLADIGAFIQSQNTLNSQSIPLHHTNVATIKIISSNIETTYYHNQELTTQSNLQNHSYYLPATDHVAIKLHFSISLFDNPINEQNINFDAQSVCQEFLTHVRFSTLDLPLTSVEPLVNTPPDNSW